MAGLASKLAIGGVLAGVVFAGRIEAEQVPSTPSLPHPTQQPRIVWPIQIAPSQRLPPRFRLEPLPDPNARRTLPDDLGEPYVVCGLTIIPAPPNVDPNMSRPLPERRAPAVRQFVPSIRRVPPATCAIEDARPRYPDAPRNR